MNSHARRTSPRGLHTDTGYYVATARHEVCVFDGGVVTADDRSYYIHWDRESSTMRILRTTIADIEPL